MIDVLFISPYSLTSSDQCTGSLMIHEGVAKEVDIIDQHHLVLSHVGGLELDVKDIKYFKSGRVNTILVLDSPWEMVNSYLSENCTRKQIIRKLPSQFRASNSYYCSEDPLYYSADNQFSTAEAVVIACFVLGFNEYAIKVLDKLSYKYKFISLNSDVLTNDYQLDVSYIINRLSNLKKNAANTAPPSTGPDFY